MDQQGALVSRDTYLASCYLENPGMGRFRQHSLPIEAQFAPVFSTQVLDLDHDGNLNLLLTGNSYAPEFVSGWYDASFGQVLKGDGKGHFTPLAASQTGFLVEVDAIAVLASYTRGRFSALAGVNSGNSAAFVPKASTDRVLRLLTDARAELTLRDGSKRRMEFYYGLGYLSQSFRAMSLSLQVQSSR